MLAIGIAVTLLAPVDVSASPVAGECRSAKPPDAREYWSWRQIDGRQCWYAGRPGRSKATLHWPAAQPTPSPEAEQPPKQPAQSQQAPRRETIGIGTVRDIEPVLKPKPVRTFAISPGPLERPMVPAASFDERFAADRWSADDIRPSGAGSGGGAAGRE